MDTATPGIAPDLDAQLDALLDESFADDADTEGNDGDGRESGQVLDGTPEGDDDDADQGLADGDDATGSLNADSPEDGADDSEEEDAGDEDPRIAALEAERDEARRQAAATARWIEEQRLAALEAEGERQYREFMASLEEMSPEDAATAKLEKIAEYAATLQRQQVQAAQQAQAEQTRTEVMNFIAGGGRLVADGRGGFVPQQDPKLALTAHEQKLLAYVTGSPRQMREFADELIGKRTQQTAAARKALAQKHRANAALATTSGEQRGATPAGKEPETLDEILDATYAKAPHLWALPPTPNQPTKQPARRRA